MEEAKRTMRDQLCSTSNLYPLTFLLVLCGFFVPSLAAEEYSQDRARREVVTHCIFGVDLNPLAVELAKVSLWLSTVSYEKPLSFLDHRLKCGNSLVGAKLVELRQFPQVEKKRADAPTEPHLEAFIPPYYVNALVSKMREIQALAEETVEDTRRKSETYGQFRLTQAYSRTKACVYETVFFGPLTRTVIR